MHIDVNVIVLETSSGHALHAAQRSFDLEYPRSSEPALNYLRLPL
jgi:hypothetical protein